MGAPTSGLLWGGLFSHQCGGECDGDLDSVVLHLRDYNEGSLLWLRGQVVHILALCEALRVCVCVCVCACVSVKHDSHYILIMLSVWEGHTHYAQCVGRSHSSETLHVGGECMNPVKLY